MMTEQETVDIQLRPKEIHLQTQAPAHRKRRHRATPILGILMLLFVVFVIINSDYGVAASGKIFSRSLHNTTSTDGPGSISPFAKKKVFLGHGGSDS
jgi:hypothetical protein